MNEIRGFVLSLCTVSAVSAVVDGIIGDSTLKKYLRYLLSLCIILILVSPVKSLVEKMPDMFSGLTLKHYYNGAIYTAEGTRVAYLERALAEKFAVPESQILCELREDSVKVKIKKRIGITESDIEKFVSDRYGLEAEAEFYE